MEHTVTRERKERRRKDSWKGFKFVWVYRYRCSCGWRSGWGSSEFLTWRLARKHSLDGQLSIDVD